VKQKKPKNNWKYNMLYLFCWSKLLTVESHLDLDSKFEDFILLFGYLGLLLSKPGQGVQLKIKFYVCLLLTTHALVNHSQIVTLLHVKFLSWLPPQLAEKNSYVQIMNRACTIKMCNNISYLLQITIIKRKKSSCGKINYTIDIIFIFKKSN